MDNAIKMQGAYRSWEGGQEPTTVLYVTRDMCYDQEGVRQEGSRQQTGGGKNGVNVSTRNQSEVSVAG